MGDCGSKKYVFDGMADHTEQNRAATTLPYRRGLDTSDGKVATVLTLLHTRKNVRIKINEWEHERRIAIHDCSQRWAHSSHGFQGYTEKVSR